MFYKIVTLLFVASIISGCASTKVTGYTDPSFSSTTYRNTTVLASGLGLERAADLETRICDAFQDQDVKCTKFTSLFPPTKRYSDAEIYSDLENRKIQSVVIVSAGGDQSASNVFGYQSYGNATAYGNSVQGSASSYAHRSYSRQSRMRVLLLDVDARRTAWIGDANTEGKGLLNVTDKAFDSSLASKIVGTLSETGRF